MLRLSECCQQMLRLSECCQQMLWLGECCQKLLKIVILLSTYLSQLFPLVINSVTSHYFTFVVDLIYRLQ